MLIDADGYIFNEKWLKDYESGGIEAAYGLRTEVLRYLQRQDGLNLPAEYDIMVNMYASQKALAKKIAEAGLVPDISAFENFVCKLNQSQPLFLWADCGPGKERVDAKIRGLSDFLWVYCPYSSSNRKLSLPRISIFLPRGLLGLLPRQWLCCRIRKIPPRSYCRA